MAGKKQEVLDLEAEFDSLPDVRELEAEFDSLANDTPKANPSPVLDPNYNGPTISQGDERPVEQDQFAPPRPTEKTAYTGPIPTGFETGVRGFGQGLTSNWYDEAVAALGTLNPAMNMTVSELIDVLKTGRLPQGMRQPVDKTYEQNLEDVRNQFATGEIFNPKAALTGEVAGIATQALSPAGRLLGPTKGVTGLTRAAQVSGAGALMGGVNAAGASEADTVEGVAEDALEGAAGGALAAPMLDKALQLGGRGLKRIAGSAAFKAMTGKYPGTAAAEEAAALAENAAARGVEPDQKLIKMNTELAKQQNRKLGEQALETGVVKSAINHPIASGAKGMVKTATQLRDTSTQEMAKLARQVDAAAGKGIKLYTMDPSITASMDDIARGIQEADDPLARKAGANALQNIKAYIQEFSATEGSEGGRATFEKGWRLLRNVQKLANDEKDPMSKWLYERFAREFQDDLLNQTIKTLDETSASVMPPDIDPNSLAYKLGRWWSKAPTARPPKAVDPREASFEGFLEGADATFGASRKMKTTSDLVNAVQSRSTPTNSEGIGLVGAGLAMASPQTAAVVGGIQKAGGARAQSTIAAITHGLSEASAPAITQKAQVPTFEDVKRRMQENPESLGKFKAFLDGVLAQQGEEGLKRTVFLLGMTNPEWQAMTAGDTE